MALSYSDLEGIWVQAGGNPSAAPIAAAVALAESGGNPSSYNGTGADNSYGLWQINMIGSLGPARRQQFGLQNSSQLFDPLTNAKAAVAISNNGANWGPWTTFTSGAYKKYLQGGVPPNLNAAGAGSAQNAGLLSNPLDSLNKTITGLFANAGNYIFFSACILGGGIVMALCVYMLIKDETMQAAASVGKNVFVGGKISSVSRVRSSTPKAPSNDRRNSGNVRSLEEKRERKEVERAEKKPTPPEKPIAEKQKAITS